LLLEGCGCLRTELSAELHTDWTVKFVIFNQLKKLDEIEERLRKICVNFGVNDRMPNSGMEWSQVGFVISWLCQCGEIKTAFW
jgi:hypothetical protein